MRIREFTLLILIITFLSCRKSNESFEYVVNNAKDLSVKIGMSISTELEVKSLSAANELVTLVVTDLPAGVSYGFSSDRGLPTFKTILTLNILNNATIGDYPIKITGTTTSGITKEYIVILHILRADQWTFGHPIYGNGTYYASSVVIKNAGDFISLEATNVSGNLFRVMFSNEKEIVDGSYKIVQSHPKPYEVSLFAQLGSTVHFMVDTVINYAAVTVTNSKVRVVAPAVRTDYQGIMSCDITQH